MSWPLSHEFNEAIQNPKVAFADPDLRDGEPVVGATGLPLPRSGNFADVYQMHGADGRDWAVKCFTRPVTGLAERYARVSDALEKANLPFNVGFKFLAEGIRVGGVWRPVVKMEWVEGMLLNQVVRDAAEKPATLGALGQMWVKLCKRLREAGIAHADLQHGNVLLVPGTRAGAYGLKLIDYDGVWVPALANTPSGESGHPSFQHPARAATRNYSPDVDRFPHLVVATALRGLSVAGTSLWERYDNGDNLLFTEDDYKKPAASKAMRDLWELDHPAVQALVGRLAIACTKPIPQTPWLDQLAPDGEPAPLDNATRHEAAAALGIALPVPVALPPEPVALPPEPAPAESPFAVVNEFDEQPGEIDAELVEEAPKTKKSSALRAKPKRGAKPAREAKSGGNGLVYAGVGAAVLVLVGIVAAVVMSGGGKPKPNDNAQNQNKEEPEPVVVPPKKGPNEPPGPKPKDNDPVVVPPDKGPNNTTPPQPVVWALRERWKQPLPDDWMRAHGLRIGADSRTGQVYFGEGKFFVFDTSTGEALKNPPDAAGIMYGVHVLNGGQVAKTWQVAGGPLQIWDARTGKEAAAVPRIINGPVLVDVSPNGKYTSACLGHGQGKVALKFGDEKGKVLADLNWTRGSVLFTADSSRALIVDGVGQCRWVKLPSGEAGDEWSIGDGTGTVRAVAMSGDGSRVVISGDRVRTQLVDGQTGKTVRYLKDEIGPAALSHDGNLLLVSRYANTRRVAEITDATTGEVQLQLPITGVFDPTSVGLAPDGSAAFVAQPAGAGKFELVRYDITAGASPAAPGAPAPSAVVKERHRIPLNFNARVTQFDGEGKSVLTYEYNQPTLTIVDTGTGATRTATAPQSLHPDNVVPLLGGRAGMCPTGSKSITVVNLETGKTVGNLALPTFPAGRPKGAFAAVRVSPDERYVAAGVSTGSMLDPDTKKTVPLPGPVQVIDTRTNKTVLTVDWLSSGQGRDIVFSADSSRVLIVDAALRGRWYKLPSGELEKEWALADADASRVRFRAASRDGRVLLCDASVNGTRRAFLVDGNTGARMAPFGEGTGAMLPLALSGDGRRALLMYQRTTREWDFVVSDTGTGSEVARIAVPRQNDSFLSAVLAPDGRSFAVFDRQKPGPLVVYDILPGPGPPGGAVAGPPGAPRELRERWVAKADAVNGVHQFHVAEPAGLVYAGPLDGEIRAFDLKTGAPKADFVSPARTLGIHNHDGVKLAVVARGLTGNSICVLDAGTGREVSRVPIPSIPTNVGQAFTASHLSPDGKFLAFALARDLPEREPVDLPVQVIELATKKVVVDTSWKNMGGFHFTADSARVLIAEESGRCRWFKLPTGAADGEWKFEGDTANGHRHRVTSISDDGSVLGYNGPAGRPKTELGPATVDGKTGNLIYLFPKDYFAFSVVKVSANGARAAAFKNLSAIDIVNARTGAHAGRATIPGPSAGFTLTNDGSSLVVMDFGPPLAVRVFDVPSSSAIAPPAVGGGDPTEGALAGEPPALRSKWDSKVGDEIAFDRLLVTPDAVLLGSAKGFSALEPKAGVPRAGFSLLPSSGVTDLIALQNGRIGTLAPKATEVRVWNGVTGGPVTRHAVPELAPGNTSPVRALLAPNEKHLAVARTLPPAGDHPVGPLKVFEATTKKEQLAVDWKGGEIHFTTDSARVLAAEWTGKCRWFKLPSGDADGEWDLGPAPADRPHRVTSASDDGTVLGYTGPLAAKGSGNGSAVLDGKTGKLIRVFHKDYHPNSAVEVSADGKRVALLREVSRRDVAIDVVELATGARVGRARFATDAAPGNTPVPLFAFAPDGRALVVYDPGRQRTHLFEVPATTGP